MAHESKAKEEAAAHGAGMAAAMGMDGAGAGAGPQDDCFPTRFALKFSPPTLVIEYTRANKRFLQRIRLKKLPLSADPGKVAARLKEKFSLLQHPAVADHQVERLVRRLMDHAAGGAAAPASPRDRASSTAAPLPPVLPSAGSSSTNSGHGAGLGAGARQTASPPSSPVVTVDPSAVDAALASFLSKSSSRFPGGSSSGDGGGGGSSSGGGGGGGGGSSRSSAPLAPLAPLSPKLSTGAPSTFITALDLVADRKSASTSASASTAAPASASAPVPAAAPAPAAAQRPSSSSSTAASIEQLDDELEALLAMTADDAPAPKPSYKALQQASGASKSNRRAKDPPPATKRSTPEELAKADLQAVDPALLAAAKAAMNTDFEANRRRPGDPDYEYDVQEEFSQGEDSNDWDEDDDDDDF